MKIKLYVPMQYVGIVKRKNPKQYPFLLGFVALQLWRTSQYIYSDTKLIGSLLYLVAHSFPSWLVWSGLFWGKDQVYCDCCFAQKAHKLVLTDLAK